jgi:CheY-like chemotaxis protein
VRAISDLPAVALTGFGMEEDVVNCRVAGFNEHLTKPINFQRLEFVIDELMRDRTTQVTMSSATTASPSSK